jgi:saccharopepsin
MKLHKLSAATPSDFSSQSAHLAEKYLGRLPGFGGSQIRFGSDAGAQGRRGGKYPPSRDGEFRTMVETEEFNEAVAKGGHGVPLTSELGC